MNNSPTHLLNYLFPSSFKRGRKPVQLPPGLNTNRETILEILHDHHLLARLLWPDCSIELVDSSSPQAATTFTFQQSDFAACVAKKVTLTSFYDGVSVLELVASGTKHLVCWTVTETAASGVHGHYCLEETFMVADDRLSSWISQFYRGCDRNTKQLMESLGQITAGNGNASSNSEGRAQVMTGGVDAPANREVVSNGRHVGAGKRKSD